MTLELRKIVGLATAVIDETGNGIEEHCDRDLSDIIGDEYTQKLTRAMYGVACVLSSDRELANRFHSYVLNMISDKSEVADSVRS